MLVCVTQYPSWSPAAPARPFSVPGGGGQAAGLWPGHETRHWDSHQAHSPPLDFGGTLYCPLTRGWRSGGGVGKKMERSMA